MAYKAEIQNNNNKRILKNTLLLYVRMIFVMVVSLYTSRVVLNALGVQDYGVYNVVGGIVSMFGFLTGGMTVAAQRFLSFSLGKNDHNQLSKIFNVTIVIHLVVALLILVLAETIGLWFVTNYLNIPADRVSAAYWVYHFTIFTFIVALVQVPFNAMIIAHEKMGIYAYVGIVEALLRLLIAFLLVWTLVDKLKLYAILLFVSSVLIALSYIVYVKIKFRWIKFIIVRDRELYKTLLSYSGWNIWGGLAAVIMGQGINILLNIFFGVAVNAARGIAFQVQNALRQFVINFQMAMNPQIIKSYAAENYEYMHSLVIRGAKFSFFLLYGLSLPILLETEIVLKIWLKIVPEYTVVFTRLVLIGVLIDTLSGTMMTAAQASGRIKIYQTVVGGLLILNLPISYIFLRYGMKPEVTMYVSIAIFGIAFFVRVKIIETLIKIKSTKLIVMIILPVIKVILLSLVLPFIFLLWMDAGYIRFFIVVFVSLLSVAGSVWLLGLSNKERTFFRLKFNEYYNRIKSS